MEQLASILPHNQRVAPTCCGSLAGADPEGPSGGGGDATQVAYLQEENETFAHLPIFLRCDEMVEVNRMKPLPKSCSQYLNHLLRRTKQFEPRPQLVPVARFLAACKPHGENGRESILVSHPRPDPQPRGPQQVGATLWLSRSKCYFGYFWRDCKYLILTFFKNITQVVYSNLFSSKPTNQVRGTNIKQIFLFFFFFFDVVSWFL